MCPLMVVSLFGCADKQAYQQYVDTFDGNAKAYYDVASKPLMDMKLPAPDGKEYHLVVNREVKPLMPQQIKDSEWTGAVTAGIVGATTLGLGVVKWKMTESDNEAAVDMNESDNLAATAQLRDYVQSFKKDSEKITIIEGGTQTITKDNLNGNSLDVDLP